METFTLPELYCPFPARINRHAEEVGQHTLTWASRYNLLGDAAIAHRLQAVRVGWLVARAYPSVAPDALLLLADWCTWLFLQDDQCDEKGVGRDPERLAALHHRSLAVLGGAPLCRSDLPLTIALADLRERIARRASERWWTRFLRSVADAFAASVWEAGNRLNGLVPDIDTYRDKRPLTGGLYTLVDLAEVTEKLYLPPDVHDHATTRLLTRHAVNAVCFANDIVSLAKELKQGDVHNLVLVLRHHQAIPLQQALLRAAALHDATVRAFVELMLHLPPVSQEVQPHMDRYVAMLQAWMRGNLDWSYASGRYLMAQMVHP